MRETQFQQTLSKKLRDAGALVLNVHGHRMQVRGWPDLQVYSHLWTGHLELKCEKGKCSSEQRHVLRELRKRGSLAFVLRNKEGALTLETPEGEFVSSGGAFKNMNGAQLLLWLKNYGVFGGVP